MPSNNLVKIFLTMATIGITLCLAGGITGPVLQWHYVPMVLGYMAVVCIMVLIVVIIMMIWGKEGEGNGPQAR